MGLVRTTSYAPEADVESTWYQALGKNDGFGDYTSNAADCTYDYSPPCPTSLRDHPSSSGTTTRPGIHRPHRVFVPWITRSTAYDLDLQLAEMRGCYDGMSNLLDNTTGDVWGCIQSWYSGAWTPGGGGHAATSAGRP